MIRFNVCNVEITSSFFTEICSQISLIVICGGEVSSEAPENDFKNIYKYTLIDKLDVYES